MTKVIEIRLALIAGLLTLAIVLPMSAQADSGATMRSGKKSTARTIDVTCMQEAVDVRETGLLAAIEEFHSDVKEALEDRKEALMAAWGESDMKARRSGIKNAMKAWKDTHKAALKEIRSERTEIWKTFRTSAKECGETVPVEESLGKDASGELAL